MSGRWILRAISDNLALLSYQSLLLGSLPCDYMLFVNSSSRESSSFGSASLGSPSKFCWQTFFGRPSLTVLLLAVLLLAVPVSVGLGNSS